ncbi:PaaX family transcriptional regulator C-terminal domain-containing protein [Neoaquamicrobium sediminum]|uniref:PaaX family transcriptional regulator n=1 Tax=Neoaquamicrobium sediminum TaxID=1849104 RepID=UPI003BAD47B1
MPKSADPAVAALETLIANLHERGRPRVWSLVITIFGDAVVPRGGRVPLTVLQDIMARLRIEPGALRTALSRLAGDKWVTRERRGRHSFFSLDEHGRHAFDLATRRIYASGPPGWAGKWTVAVAAPGANAQGSELPALGFVRISGGVHMRPETDDAPDATEALAGMLVIHGESAEHPEAFRDLWPSQEIADAYHAFIAAFHPLHQALRNGSVLVPIDAIAARTLLVHDWRRIVLRDPGLPGALLPPSWPGAEARSIARDIHEVVAETSEAWLDMAGLPEPADPSALARRWRDPRQSSR